MTQHAQEPVKVAELEPCPHCGGQPTFTDPEDKDERRYIEMTLGCCATMDARLGWGVYKNMSKEERQSALTADLTEQWNTRAALSSAPVPPVDGKVEPVAWRITWYDGLVGLSDTPDISFYKQSPPRIEPLYLRPPVDLTRAEVEAENERLREALTPSGATKAAYISEFHFTEEIFDGDTETYLTVRRTVPWTVVKEIMTAIAARAALSRDAMKGGEA